LADKVVLDELVSFGFIPSGEEIQRELIMARIPLDQADGYEKDELLFFLTSQGSVLWETIFRPEWNKYIARRGDGIVRKLYCADFSIGKKIIEMDHLINYDNESSYHLVSGTEMWEEIIPWQVNYWKALPVGYCVSYQSERVIISESQELIQERKKAHDFLMDVWRWYDKNYYDDLVV
jgi:hypothetical protein